MWANGSPAYFSGLVSVPAVPMLRDRAAQNGDKTSGSRRDLAPPKTSNLSFVELYQPAVEGPPSPESLRQLNVEMRLATNLRRGGQGHKVASSASSITSFTGDLDTALENIDLVRRSSFNSIESSNVSKDMSESFQAFGKNLFHRRGRSKQESTSSGSSLYSADASMDTTAASKDSVLPKLFNRRKPSRDESAAAVQKRFQISGPFNFQHVTHTNRDDADGPIDEEQQDASLPRGRPRALTGASDHTYTNVLAETVAEHGDITDIPPPRPGLIARHTGSFQTMRRFIKPGKVSELSVPTAATTTSVASSNRQAPQRPPRSPLEPNDSPSAVSPPRPPRVSSRQMFYPSSIDTTASYPIERPLTSGGFQRPQPFSPTSPIEQLPTPTRLAFTPPADLSSSTDGLPGRAQADVPEPAWPLASPTIVNFDAPLPDLVEDDGHPSWSSRSHGSRNSNNASLRGSKSVPMLRQLAQGQSETADDQSQAETDAWSAQMKTELEESLEHSLTLGRASWEDDIDYCYEHEAEADCDYQWERPSMDIAHGGMMYATSSSFSALDEALAKSTVKRSPGMISAPGCEVPALSPASQTSAVLGHEAVTPLTNYTGGTMPHTQFGQNKDEDSLSTLPSPRESQGFQFSPSLLVPQDYQRNSLATTPEEPETSEGGGFIQYNQPEQCYGARSHLYPSMQRSSTATTESNYTSSTDSVGERHTSANSSWSALTRHTASTSSLNKLATSWVEEAEPVPALASTKNQDLPEDNDTTPPASEDVVPELAMAMPPASGRRAMHKSHASESVLRKDVGAMDLQQLPKPRRPRARTSSLSQPPPVGQYALFPRSSIKVQGDRI